MQEHLQGSGRKKYRLAKGSFQEELFSGMCDEQLLQGHSPVLKCSLISVLVEWQISTKP